MVDDTVTHACEELSEVGAAKVGAGLELSKRVDISTNRVEDDVLRGIHIELLSKVGVNLQKFYTARAGDTSSLARLVLERREESLKPLERAGIFAHPDELDTTETGWWVGAVAQMPDVLEDRGPWRNTNTGSDQNGDFILEHILRGSTVGSINAKMGHALAVLEGDFVHSHRVNRVVKLSLGRTSTETITEISGEITNLPDVNGHIRVKGARSDGERMPLVSGNVGDLEEQPLPGLVLERRLVELDLDDVVWVPDDTGDLGLTGGTDFTPQTLDKVETTGPELPSPTQVTDAMLPVVVTSEWRETLGGVTDEAADSMSVEGEEEWDEEMVSVPEGLEGLLSNAVMGGRVHQKHAEQHDVAGDTTGLGVVNLKGGNGTNLRLLDVVEVDIMGGGVDDGEEKHSICQLSVHPDVLIERKEPNGRSDPFHDGPAHRQQDQHTIDAQYQTGTTRAPD